MSDPRLLSDEEMRELAESLRLLEPIDPYSIAAVLTAHLRRFVADCEARKEQVRTLREALVAAIELEEGEPQEAVLAQVRAALEATREPEESATG